jgi:Fe-S cluster assembly scaffold protein SufB
MTYKSKYYNVRTRALDGTVFDSYKEARRWDELLLLQKAGKITELRRQVEYELIPNQYETYERYGKKGQRLKDGVRLVEHKVVYRADFVYTDTETGENIVEDTKGIRTPDYIIKRKLMLAVHSIRIKEV